MSQGPYKHLFRPLKIDGLRLKNRITMAPLYLGYAAWGGKVSSLLLKHYRAMARSGASLVVVENASITPGGSGGGRTIRADHNRYLQQLRWLSDATYTIYLYHGTPILRTQKYVIQWAPPARILFRAALALGSASLLVVAVRRVLGPARAHRYFGC